jgi:hypothetical protein
MRKPWGVLAGSVLCLLVVSAAAPRAARAEPSWCKSAEGNLSFYGPLKNIYTEDDPRDAVYSLVSALCFPDDEAKGEAAKIEATQKEWSKKLAMTDEDWNDAAVWASHGQGERNSPSMYPRDTKAAWSTWTPIDQYAGILNSDMGDSSRVVDWAYMTDAFGAKLTEAGRLAYITKCLGSGTGVVEMAMCQPDIAALDLKKLNTELHGDTAHDGYQRMNERIAAYQLQPQIKQRAADVKALVAKDPGYAQMFTLSENARKEWSKVDPKLVDLTAAMDDARVTNSRKASEGCAEKTWDAFKGVVSGIPAKSFALQGEPGNSYLEKAMSVVINTPNGYLASVSLFLCAKVSQKEDYLTHILGSGLSYWPGYRGPRTAAHTAILTAGITLDDRDARIEYPNVGRPWLSGSGSSSGGGTGTVASVKAKGDKQVIEFAKVKSSETQCSKGHYTNRVTQIRSDGQLVYEYVCQATKVVSFNEPPAPPQNVNPRYAVGLKKGMFVSVVEDVVIEGFAKSGAANPSFVVGIPVK